MPGREGRARGWLIVVAVTLVHLGILGWAKYGASRAVPRKSEITIELGTQQARAGGEAGQPPGPAPTPPATPATPKPAPPVPRPLPPSVRQPVPADPEQAVAPQAPASPSPAATAAAASPAAAIQPAAPANAAGGGGGASATGADQPVAYLNNPKPPYPRMALMQGVEGTVRLRVLVQADGSASEVRLAQSSGHESLDQSALETVAKWKFTPARSQGKETAQWVGVPITFSLKRR